MLNGYLIYVFNEHVDTFAFYTLVTFWKVQRKSSFA